MWSVLLVDTEWNTLRSWNQLRAHSKQTSSQKQYFLILSKWLKALLSSLDVNEDDDDDDDDDDNIVLHM